MKVRKYGTKIEISFAYQPHLVSFVKSLEGRSYSQASRTWFIPLANASVNIQRLTERGFQVEESLLQEVGKDIQEAQEAEQLAQQPDAEFNSPLPLFPFQKVGAAFLHKVGSGILADDMGLGKTIQALAVCEYLKAEKVLIFCPASVKWQWAQEIKKFAGKDAVVVEGTPKERNLLWTHKDFHTYFIANYELLLRDFNYLSARDWDVIIGDEATRISNPRARQSKLIKKLKAKRRLALTGTPISNRAQEIWNLVDFCQPGAIGKYWDFINRYCLKNKFGGIEGYQNLDELQSRLKRYMIRRMKIDVLPELPAKITTDIPFELSDEEKALYKRLKKEILFEIEKQDISKMENPISIQYTLVKMTRLRQLADSMELLGTNSKSSKLEVLKDLLSEALVEGKKAIIFTQFAKMADILERELAEYKPLKISGAIKERYKDVVDKFNTDQNNFILIMTSAGQYGLNIQRASIIFHYDQEWSLAKMLQRTGRAYRYGQKEKVLEYNLLAIGTIDYYIKKVLHGKTELSNKVLGDVPLTMDNIKEMLNYEE